MGWKKQKFFTVPVLGIRSVRKRKRPTVTAAGQVILDEAMSEKEIKNGEMS